MPARNHPRASIALGTASLLAFAGCAHKRDIYSARPAASGPGVHVRAPFVDLHVQGKPKGGAVARDREEPRLSRLPVDREEDDD